MYKSNADVRPVNLCPQCDGRRFDWLTRKVCHTCQGTGEMQKLNAGIVWTGVLLVLFWGIIFYFLLCVGKA